MSWKEVEYIFNRALKFSFSKRKLLFTVPVLIFCGLLIACFRALGVISVNYVAISMTFLPIFFIAAVLIAAGIILARIYHHEVKGIGVHYRKTLSASRGLMIEVAYLAIPIVLSYLILWAVLGIFFLFREIPLIGDALGVVLSFGPFLLLLGSFVLSLLCLAGLFFIVPAVAFKSSVETETLLGVLKRIKFNPFSNAMLLFLGMLPLLLIVGVMTVAAVVTGKSYVAARAPAAIGMEWFSIMLPFSALLAPGVIFFFNFSAEAHVLMVKKQKEAECG